MPDEVTRLIEGMTENDRVGGAVHQRLMELTRGWWLARWTDLLNGQGLVPMLIAQGPARTLMHSFRNRPRPARYGLLDYYWIKIWIAIVNWVGRRVPYLRARRFGYEPGGRAYLRIRERFRYHQGLRVTRTQKRKWGSF